MQRCHAISSLAPLMCTGRFIYSLLMCRDLLALKRVESNRRLARRGHAPPSTQSTHLVVFVWSAVFACFSADVGYKKLAASCAAATASRSAKEVMFHRRSFVRWDKNNPSKILGLLASKCTGVVFVQISYSPRTPKYTHALNKSIVGCKKCISFCFQFQFPPLIYWSCFGFSCTDTYAVRPSHIYRG